MSRSSRSQALLQNRPPSVSVERMPTPRVSPEARARRAAVVSRRVRRIGALTVVSIALLVTLVVSAFGSGPSYRTASLTPAPAKRLLPSGPPRPHVIALRGSLRLMLPVAQSRVTAIGYHAVDDGSLELQPVGRRANEGLLDRLVRRVLGGSGSGLAYYQLDGGAGPETAVLDVGAAPGTDVYAPVDGTVVAITDHVLNGRKYGSRIDLQPTGAPSLVVSLTHLRADPALTVGAPVAASSSKLGTLLDLSAVERQALARYTQDSGNHVTVGVRPSATLAIP